MAKLFTVQTNTAPAINLTLKRSGVAIDLTDAEVDLFITTGGTTTNGGHTACSILSAANGTATYSPLVTDFGNPATYECEVKITYDDGTVERLYETFKVLARTKLST